MFNLGLIIFVFTVRLFFVPTGFVRLLALYGMCPRWAKVGWDAHEQCRLINHNAAHHFATFGHFPLLISVLILPGFTLQFVLLTSSLLIVFIKSQFFANAALVPVCMPNSDVLWFPRIL